MFPYNLKTDYAFQPMNVADGHPLLSWCLESTIANDYQTACRVLVATAPERLRPEKADCWDSGDVLSSVTRLRYGGRPLRSYERVYWTVAVRDAAGVWSDLADVTKLRHADTVFTPQMAPEAAEKLCARWEKAVSRSRSWAEE